MDGTTNTWLAILAISSLISTVVLVTALIVVAMSVRRVSEQLMRLQREHLEPLAARLALISDDVRDGLGRLRTADDEVRRVVARGADTAADVVRAASHLWPALGVARGAASAVSFLARRWPAKKLKNRPALPAVGHFREGV